MPAGLGPRFLIEAGFLVAVAVIAGFARLGTVTIIVVMAGAWLLMAAVEWVIARARPAQEPLAAPAEALAERREPPAVRTVAPVAERPPAQPARAPDAAPEPSPEPEVTPGPSIEPAPEPEPEGPAEPAPAETPPEQPRVAVVAAAPQPEPPPPEPEPRVIAFTSRALGVPQHWNLWELERVARERSGADAIRDEERSFLLMYLREFADADGVLPTSFDTVVREAFGDVLDAVGA